MTDRTRSIEAVEGIPSPWKNKWVFQHLFIHSLTHSLATTLYIVLGTGSSEVRQKPVLKELAVQ